MSYIEAKEAQLKSQIIAQTKEADFESFWDAQVTTLRSVPLRIERKKMNLPYKTFTAYQINFNTHDDTIATAYFCVPNTYDGKPLPCVAVYHGGGGSYGIFPQIVSAGVCTFSIDNRSQGGITYDRAHYDVVLDYKAGIMSHGLLDKENFYMKNLYLDAIRAIDVIETLNEVDSKKIVSYGISQGGALSIVAAALSGKVIKAYPTVPSYSCLQSRVEAGSGVFEAVKSYLRRYPSMADKVFNTLSYFDINNMVSLLKVQTNFFLGLADPICLPPFVYSPYAHTNAPKRIIISPFTPHEISREYLEQILFEFSAL